MAAKTCYMKKWQKYGIEVLKTMERAHEIDREMGTTYIGGMRYTNRFTGEA